MIGPAGVLVAALLAIPQAHEPTETLRIRPLTVDRVEVLTLKSEINGISYDLFVSLPHGYASSDRSYPLVVTLDAEYSFLIARNITDHLAERRHLDEVIVVAIGYSAQKGGRDREYRINRTRDYTPIFVEKGGYGVEIQKVSGGGETFLRVIESEILPLIDDRYRTLDRGRTLVGHSYGGLFALFSVLREVRIFDRVIAVSPSLWYGNHHLFDIENALAAETRRMPVQIYLCVGERERNESIDMVSDVKRLSSDLARHDYEGLSLTSRVLDGETHNSIFPRCLSDGLRELLGGR